MAKHCFSENGLFSHLFAFFSLILPLVSNKDEEGCYGCSLSDGLGKYLPIEI